MQFYDTMQSPSVILAASKGIDLRSQLTPMSEEAEGANSVEHDRQAPNPILLERKYGYIVLRKKMVARIENETNESREVVIGDLRGAINPLTRTSYSFKGAGRCRLIPT